MHPYVTYMLLACSLFKIARGRHGRDRMVVWFI